MAEETIVVILEDRIAELEKLSTMQKATIDALGKELREAEDLRKRNSQKWRTLQKEQLTFRDPEWKVVCDIIANGFTMSEMTQKGPELFICPAHGVSEMCPTCHHSKPHEHTGETCNFDGVRCKKCIPYKGPAQTPAPEEGRSPIQHLQDRVLELEQHQGRDRADRMEKIVFKLKDQIKGLEHRLGMAQDRIAEIHPSGCVPPMKNKPKSRLKTDRVKKVKP